MKLIIVFGENAFLIYKNSYRIVKHSNSDPCERTG